MGFPVNCIGCASGTRRAASYSATPTRTIRCFLPTAQIIFPRNMKATPPNIWRSVTSSFDRRNRRTRSATLLSNGTIGLAGFCRLSETSGVTARRPVHTGPRLGVAGGLLGCIAQGDSRRWHEPFRHAQLSLNHRLRQPRHRRADPTRPKAASVCSKDKILSGPNAVEWCLRIADACAEKDQRRSTPEDLEPGARSPFPRPVNWLVLERILPCPSPILLQALAALNDDDCPRLIPTGRRDWRLYSGPEQVIQKFARDLPRFVGPNRSTAVHSFDCIHDVPSARVVTRMRGPLEQEVRRHLSSAQVRQLRAALLPVRRAGKAADQR